jgi:hypothetical protein
MLVVFLLFLFILFYLFYFLKCNFLALTIQIFFLLTRIRLRFMELELIKREWSGAQNDSVIESERLTQFEIMDGSPVKGLFACLLVCLFVCLFICLF